MLTFIISILALIAGYLLYGKFVERVFNPKPDRPTPAVSRPDGVDYIPLPTWKVFMIQFLNIAGTGPIFGAIMGAKFGPASYLWIVLGCIFAGAVHDYLSGMLSVRHDGASLPDLIGKYLGQGTKKVMLVFTVILLILVGAVFVYSPSLILGDIAGDGSRNAIMIWAAIIFAYYLIATILPIDKIIGKIYPLFAISLIFMAIALMVCDLLSIHFSYFIALLLRFDLMIDVVNTVSDLCPDAFCVLLLQAQVLHLMFGQPLYFGAYSCRIVLQKLAHL